MKLLSNISIRQKLVIIIAGISLITLSIGYVFLLIDSVKTYKSNLVTTAIQNTELMGTNSIIPLTFNDHERAKNNLGGLIAFPSVRRAALFTADSSLFSEYIKNDAEPTQQVQYREYGEKFQDDYLHIFRPVFHQGQKLGTIYLVVSTTDLRAKINRDIAVFTAILVFLVLLSGVLAAIIQRSVTDPILELADTMEKVTKHGDYSTRVQQMESNEIGSLYQGFNDMLEQIETSQRQLQASKDRFENLANLLPECVFETDLEMTVIYANQIAFDLFGFSREDFQKGLNALEMIVPEHRERARKNLSKRLQGEILVPMEYQALRKDGTSFPIMFHAVGMYHQGVLKGIRGVVIDITERKRAEDELTLAKEYIDSIVDSMPSVLISVDMDLKVTHLNKQAQQESDLEWEQTRNQPVADLFPEMLDHLDLVTLSIQKQEPHEKKKVHFSHQGENRYWDITVYPLHTANTRGAVIRLDDVTERVRIEEMIMQTEKMVSVGGLAAGMAHEINNPLSGMMQNAEVALLRLTKDSPANYEAARSVGTSMAAIGEFMEKRSIVEHLQMIREAGKQAASTVQDMLSFSRIDSFQRSKHHLSDLLDRTVKLAENDYDLQKKYDFRSVRIIRDYDRELPMVTCESGKIQQVFYNILKNAAEAMTLTDWDRDHDLESTIHLRLQHIDRWAQIEIQDNGPGMDPIVSKRIFEPFFTTKPGNLGTGLGLFSAFFIITDTHAGELRVESELGKGSTFIIRLPFE